MSNLSALISGGGAAGAAAEGGSTMVTSTGIAAQDIVAGDSVKLTGSGQFIKDAAAGDRYFINKRYIADADGHAQTPYLWPASTGQRGGSNNDDLPMAITLSTGHTMVYGHPYIATNSKGYLKFFTLKAYASNDNRFEVVDEMSVSQGYRPEALKFYEIGNDASNVYVMAQYWYRRSSWPYPKYGYELFFAVDRTTGVITQKMSTNSSGYPGNSLFPGGTDLVQKLDAYVRGDMAGDIACYGMQNASRNYNDNNQSTYGYAFRKLDPTTTLISASTSFSTPTQIKDWDDKAGVIAVDQADRVFIAWHKEYQVDTMKAQVVKFDASGAMTIVTPWYDMYASGSSTSLTSAKAYAATFIKAADGTVALINSSTDTQLEVQKFEWNGTALVESGSVYTIDVTANSGAMINPLSSSMNMASQVAYSRNQYKNDSFYFGRSGSLVEIDLVNDKVNVFHVGYFGGTYQFPSSHMVMGSKYVTLQHVQYSGSAPWVTAASYAQLKDDVITQEDVAVVTTGASAGGTATVQLNPGIVSQAPLPISKYITKDSMAYPLATRLPEDAPTPPLFHVAKELGSAPSSSSSGSNYTTFGSAAGYGDQWNTNIQRNDTSNATQLCAVNGMGNIELYVGSTNTSHYTVNAGFQIILDGVVVWENFSSMINYSDMNTGGGKINVYSGNFNKSIVVNMRCYTTDWNFSIAKKLTMY